MKDYIMKLHEKSQEYILIALNSLVGEKNWRDLGKIMAESNEFIQMDWINKNTSLKVTKRKDFDGDPDASGYDLITTDRKLKIQCKLRATTLHLEQTRRKSGKNKRKENNTGHVRYRVDEADVFIFSRPNLDCYLNIEEWEYIVIPSWALEDPKVPGYLLPSVPKKVWKKFQDNSKQRLEDIYESVSNR